MGKSSIDRNPIMRSRCPKKIQLTHGKKQKLDINSENESMPKKTPKSIGGKIPDARIRNLGHRAQRRMNLQTNVIRKN